MIRKAEYRISKSAGGPVTLTLFTTTDGDSGHLQGYPIEFNDQLIEDLYNGLKAARRYPGSCEQTIPVKL